MPTAQLPSYMDSTMMSTFRACPRKFYHEFVLGLRPVEVSVDLHAGAAFSASLERFYQEFWINGLSHDVALARAYATFTHEWGDFEVRNPNSPKTPENMWDAVEAYLKEYPPKHDSCQPYLAEGIPSFEFSFAIPLDMEGFPRHPVSGDPFIYTGRFDMFARWNGIPAVRDEKTAGRLESNWAEKWDLRSQFLGYCWALQHSGIKCQTVVVRGVIVTRKQPVRLIEAVKQYPQFLIDRWFDQLRRDLNRLVKCWEESYFDYNLGDSCTAYSHCSFVPLCSSPQPEVWYSNFKESRWNPLLRNPTGAAPPTFVAANYATSGKVIEKYKSLLPPDALIR